MFSRRPTSSDTIHRLFMNNYGHEAWKKSRLHIFSLRRLHQRRSLSGAILSPSRRRMQRDTREDTSHTGNHSVWINRPYRVPQCAVLFSHWVKSISPPGKDSHTSNSSREISSLPNLTARNSSNVIAINTREWFNDRLDIVRRCAMVCHQQTDWNSTKLIIETQRILITRDNSIVVFRSITVDCSIRFGYTLSNDGKRRVVG